MAKRESASKPYWEVYEGQNKWWYFRLKGANHETVELTRFHGHPSVRSV